MCREICTIVTCLRNQLICKKSVCCNMTTYVFSRHLKNYADNIVYTITFTKFLLQEPKLETITRETIETFRGQRTECKFTTEKKDLEDKFPADLIEALTDKAKRTTKRGIVKVSKTSLMIN